jgi:hypothetical protein
MATSWYIISGKDRAYVERLHDDEELHEHSAAEAGVVPGVHVVRTAPDGSRETVNSHWHTTLYAHGITDEGQARRDCAKLNLVRLVHES